MIVEARVINVIIRNYSRDRLMRLLDANTIAPGNRGDDVIAQRESKNTPDRLGGRARVAQ